jgi:TonB family protein
VILPKSLLDSVHSEDIQRIIAHERAHIGRHDVAANAIQRCIEAALFFNPFAWFIGRQVTFSREAACDDLALAGGDPESFAVCLAQLGNLRRSRALLATPSAVGSRHALVMRIERLLSGDSPAQLTTNYYAIGGTVIIFIAMTLILQAISPAQQPASPGASTLNHAVATTSCATRNADAAVTKEVPPQLSKPEHGWVEMRITISPDGIPTDVRMTKSSGNTAINEAAAQAAVHSTYSPKIVNCKRVEGSYLFRVQM